MTIVFWRVCSGAFLLLFTIAMWLNSRLATQSKDLLGDLGRAYRTLRAGADDLEGHHGQVMGEFGGEEDWNRCRAGECVTCRLVKRMRGAS